MENNLKQKRGMHGSHTEALDTIKEVWKDALKQESPWGPPTKD